MIQTTEAIELTHNKQVQHGNSISALSLYVWQRLQGVAHSGSPASILLCNSFINELIAESELVHVCTRATEVHHLPIHWRLRNNLILPVSTGDPMNNFVGF